MCVLAVFCSRIGIYSDVFHRIDFLVVFLDPP